MRWSERGRRHFEAPPKAVLEMRRKRKRKKKKKLLMMMIEWKFSRALAVELLSNFASVAFDWLRRKRRRKEWLVG